MVILITGASAGLGRAMALRFVRGGWKVAVTARRADRLAELQQECARLPGMLLPIEADVTDAAAMQRVVQQIDDQWGRLDVVVANAGLGQRGALVEATWDDLDVVLRTNIDGVLHTVRAGVPLMRRTVNDLHGVGHIVLISSVVAQAVGPFSTIYSASKAAVNAIGRGLREELRSDGIRVTNVLLGQTHTEFTSVRRGTAGRTAAALPTMSAEYVAERLYRAVGTNKRYLTLRLIDYAINLAGTFAPWIMDRLLARVYRPK